MVRVKTERKSKKPEAELKEGRRGNNIILFCLDLDLFVFK